ncbi:MAG: ATP-binding cassette domain-containing protein [Kocuria sp.]|nr:ATP-binding cassette domain-containing protein [Kocuria sp.]
MNIPMRIANVSKSYNGRQVLKDVSFEVPVGKVVGLLGPNGAGKTTLMKIAGGINSPQSGTIEFFGQPYHTLDNPLSKVGFLLSAEWVDKRLTCASALKAQSARAGKSLTKQAVESTLTSVGLKGEARTRVSRLSLGMRQRLALALAFMSRPRLLILDEPINGLDADGVLWVRSEIRNFVESGGSVLLSSHLMSEMSLVADRIVILRDGCIVMDKDLYEIAGSSVDTFIKCDDHWKQEDIAHLANSLAASIELLNTNEIQILETHPADAYQALRPLDVRVTELRGTQQSLEDAYLASSTAGDDHRADHDRS